MLVQSVPSLLSFRFLLLVGRGKAGQERHPVLAAFMTRGLSLCGYYPLYDRDWWTSILFGKDLTICSGLWEPFGIVGREATL